MVDHVSNYTRNLVMNGPYPYRGCHGRRHNEGCWRKKTQGLHQRVEEVPCMAGLELSHQIKQSGGPRVDIPPNILRTPSCWGFPFYTSRSSVHCPCHKCALQRSLSSDGAAGLRSTEFRSEGCYCCTRRGRHGVSGRFIDQVVERFLIRA